ncbi:radical SAM protein [Candidatus Woesearchaeota archaeon]|nr:radical SAM protein [Candidatus Woesearchaeota archaeon]
MERKLIEVAYEITHRCNLRCSHCYNARNLGAHNEMSTQQVLEAIEKLSAFGVEKLKIGGGEPLLRRDLFDIYSAATQAGFEISFSTNGLLVKENMGKILKHGVKKVQVSIDGIEEDHDLMRGRRGLFRIAKEAIGLLVQSGVSVNVATTITSSNISSLERILEFCEDKEVSKWKVMKYIPKGCGDSLLPSKEGYESAVKKLLAKKDKWEGHTEIIVAREYDRICHPPDYNDMQCFGGKSFASLKPNGDVTPCSYISDIICGNLTKDPIWKIWNNPLMLMFSRDCYDDTCKFSARCRGGCKAVSYFLSNGKEIGCDPYCWVKEN